MRPNRFQIQRDQLAAQGPQKWLDTLLPKIIKLRTDVSQRDPFDIAQKSGAMIDHHHLRLILWNKEYKIDFPDCIVQDSNGDEARLGRQLLVLMYLNTADGTPPTHRWLRYRELPTTSQKHSSKRRQSWAARSLPLVIPPRSSLSRFHASD